MATVKRIIRNTTFLSSAYIGQKILSFVYFTLIANIAGVLDTGAYVFALSYTTIFSVLVDFGFSNLIQRKIAQKPEDAEKTVETVLTAKVLYGLVSVIIAVVGVQFVATDQLTKTLVYIATVIMLFDSYNLTVWGAFRGLHQLAYESISIVISQSIVLLIGITGLFMGANLVVLILALFSGSFFTFCYASIIAKKKLGFWPLPQGKWQDVKPIAKEALPFGFANTFTRIFSSIDSVMLNAMVGQAAVGFYSIPNKVVFALQFIPAAFAATIYPAMSHHYKTNKLYVVSIFEQSMIFLLMISIPTAAGIYLLTPYIIGSVFSVEYAPSVPAMFVLVWAIIFGFCEFPIGSLLAAAHQQEKNMYTRGIVMTVNIILNIILIPTYSFIGASISALVGYMLLTFIGFWWASKVIAIPYRSILLALLKIIASAVIMSTVVYILLGIVHYLVAALLGAIIYTIFVLLFKVVTFKQLKNIKTMFKAS